MSSAGQIVGGIAGAVVGFFTPAGPIIGAQVGMMIGGYIDPPKGPTIEGPRLDNLTVQTATYGAPKNRAYGTVPVVVNVFWLENDRYAEHEKTSNSGGKGGSSTTQKSFSYSATFAVALTEGQQITGVRRLWVGDFLVYDAASDQLESTIASNLGLVVDSSFAVADKPPATQPIVNWKFYDGSDTQAPDPRMQADKGVANVSGYPGRAYIVIYDLDLTEHYQNTLLSAQVKAELVCDGSLVMDVDDVSSKTTGPLGLYDERFDIRGVKLTASGVDYIIWDQDEYGGIPIKVDWSSVEFPYAERHISSTSTLPLSGGWGYSYRVYDVTQSDTDLLLTSQVEYSGYYYPWYRLIGPGGVIDSTERYLGSPDWESGGYVVFDREDIYLLGSSGKLQEIDIFNGVVMQTSAYTSPVWASASENYVFIVTNAGATVRKISRIDFSEVGTYTMPATVNSLFVVDDSTFYASAGATIYKYANGSLAATFSNVFSSGCTHQFVVFSDDPFYGVATRFNAGINVWTWSIAHAVLSASPALLRDIVTTECERVGIQSGDLDLLSLTNSEVDGYRVSGVGSPRGALEPLQAAYPFDVYQKGYKVAFKSRGSSSVATVNEVDLGAGANAYEPPLLPVAREMETQIARMVTVKYLDATRDYDISEQTSPERPGVSSVEPRTVDLAIVMSADKAAQTADVLCAKDWTERVTFGPFSLPPTYAALEPADVITVIHRGRSWQIRLVHIEYFSDGRLSCTGVLTGSSDYTSTATGYAPLSLGSSLVPLFGRSYLVALDIPAISTYQDSFGLVVGAWGESTSWPGAGIYRSDDNGASFENTNGILSKTEVFTATSIIGAGRTDIIDSVSILTVQANYSTADLFSITDEQLFSLGNIAAYGDDERWEIIAFKTTSFSGGVYTLSDFMRGRFGTDWAMETHEVGDRLIMLDLNILRFSPMTSAFLNIEKLWSAVTVGASVASGEVVPITYKAANLKPLAPIRLSGTRNPSTFDWTLTATRRTRTPVEPFSGLVAPLGEASELYDVEIWDSDYSILKRTFSGLSSASASYSAAQQITDFGSEQSTIYVRYFQVSAQVGRGYALEDSIYRYIPLDIYGDQVKLLMHMDDTGLTDVFGHAITLNAGAARSSAQSAFGGYSAAFTGSGEYLSTPNSSDFNFGADDFTIEMWVYKTGNNANGSRLWGRNGDVYDGIITAIDASGNLISYGSSSNTGWDLWQASNIVAVPNNVWKWIVFQRRGGTIDCYFHGVLYNVTSSLWTPNLMSNTAYDQVIGGQAGTNKSHNGYIDEVRITKGVARYSGATITVPTSSFPNP